MRSESERFLSLTLRLLPHRDASDVPMPLSSRILQKDPLAASRSPARMSHLGNAFSHVMKPFLAVLAFAALSLQAQTPIERQQEQLARQMAAQQQGQAVVTQQLNAENDRLLRN